MTGVDALFERLDHQFGGFDAGLADLLQVSRVLLAGLLGFGDGDADVAAIGDDVAQRFKMRLEAGDAHGGGAHVHAAARLAEVERNADDADLARRQRLHAGVHGLVAASGLCVNRIFVLRHRWDARLREWQTTVGKPLRIDTVQRSGKWDGFADVLQAADPGDGALDAHAEAGVRNGSVAAQVEIPLEGVEWAAGGPRCAASAARRRRCAASRR